VRSVEYLSEPIVPRCLPEWTRSYQCTVDDIKDLKATCSDLSWLYMLEHTCYN